MRIHSPLRISGIQFLNAIVNVVEAALEKNFKDPNTVLNSDDWCQQTLQ